MSPGYPCCVGCQGPTACPNCDAGTVPSSITATFSNGTNNAGDESGCSVDCDDWAAAWELPQLTQAQVDSLNASCSAAFTDQPDPVAGCYYGLTDGLPCGADALILEILDGGTAGAGAAQGGLTICDSGGIAGNVRLDWVIATADTDQDCIVNIDTGGTGVDSANGIAGDSDPCDFIGWFLDSTLLDLEAIA